MERKEKEQRNIKIYGEKDPFNYSEPEEEIRKSMERIVEEDDEIDSE